MAVGCDRRRGDKAAFIDGLTGRTVSYADWTRNVQQAAAGLAARGFAKGHVCAIFSPNLPEYATAFHAVSLAGRHQHDDQPALHRDGAGQQLEDAGARCVITVPHCLGKAKEAARGSAVRELSSSATPKERSRSTRSLRPRHGHPSADRPARATSSPCRTRAEPPACRRA